jgi:hypothetical protein
VHRVQQLTVSCVLFVCVHIFVQVKETGWVKISSIDVNELHDKYAAEKENLAASAAAGGAAPMDV